MDAGRHVVQLGGERVKKASVQSLQQAQLQAEPHLWLPGACLLAGSWPILLVADDATRNGVGIAKRFILNVLHSLTNPTTFR